MRPRRKRLFGGVVEHPVGFYLPDNLSSDDWQTLLTKASRDRSHAQWRIADLLNFGEHRYDDAYNQAIEATGLSYKTIANIKSVAARVELSRRRENLSFAHHAEVAALAPADQDRLLDLAADAGWSRGALREEVEKSRGALVARNPGVYMRVEHVEKLPMPITIKVIESETNPNTLVLSAPERDDDARDADEHRLGVARTLIRQYGGASLASDLHKLVEWQEEAAPRLDAVEAALAQQLREKIARRLSAMKPETTAPEQQPARRQLH